MSDPEVPYPLRDREEEVVPNYMVYQPVRLRKEMGQCEKSASGELCPIPPLVSCEGLDPVEPDNTFREGSILHKFCSGQSMEFLMCITMYNEGETEFLNTMKGVMANMKEFADHGIGTDQIGCVVIVDGTEAFMKTYRDGNLNNGTFNRFCDPEMAKTRFNVPDLSEITKQLTGTEEIAHCFQQVYQYKDTSLNLIFCIKQKNMRKLNTHLWFFCGFCKLINPRFVMLLDVGTKPHDTSLWKLYEAMDRDPNLAGCCGEIVPMDPPMFNWVVPAQVVEYKYAHIFDKALESVCGYISVLPGAFSAYRWDQLLGNEQDGSPLWNDYFRSMTHPHEMNAYYSNIYLAEDRVLTLALVSMKNRANILRYVRDSIAETDVPDTFHVLMLQRRRWINGSWFALIEFLREFSRIYASDHSCVRKLVMTLQIIWYFSTMIMTWIMVGVFALMIEDLLVTLGVPGEPDDEGFSITALVMVVYAGLIVTVFILALAVERPKQVENTYKVISGMLGFYMLAMVILMVRFLFNMGSNPTPSQQWIYAFAFILMLIMLLVPLLYGCLSTILKHLFMFLMMCPTYVNIFVIYAICNTHDCTWGNRDTVKNEAEMKQRDEFSLFRCRWAIVWAACNLGFYEVFHMLALEEVNHRFNAIYLVGLYAFIALLSRFIGSICYFVQERWYQRKYEPGNAAQAALRPADSMDSDSSNFQGVDPSDEL